MKLTADQWRKVRAIHGREYRWPDGKKEIACWVELYGEEGVEYVLGSVESEEQFMQRCFGVGAMLALDPKRPSAGGAAKKETDAKGCAQYSFLYFRTLEDAPEEMRDEMRKSIEAAKETGFDWRNLEMSQWPGAQQAAQENEEGEEWKKGGEANG